MASWRILQSADFQHTYSLCGAHEAYCYEKEDFVCPKPRRQRVVAQSQGYGGWNRVLEVARRMLVRSRKSVEPQPTPRHSHIP